MKTTAEIIDLLRNYKMRSAEKYGIVSFGIFGSVARGEQRDESDLDLFIKLRKPDFFVRMAIKEELEQLFQTKIDLIAIHDTMRALLRKNIENDAIYI